MFDFFKNLFIASQKLSKIYTSKVLKILTKFHFWLEMYVQTICEYENLLNFFP